MKKFLIIPGLPRCATTSLANVLGKHPQIFLPKIKEPHFFLPDKEAYFMFNRKGKKHSFFKTGFISSIKDFEINYNNFNSEQIFIDGSTLYCVHLEALENLRNFADIDPYFIILRKDPFKRAVSHYLYSISRGEEFRTFDKALQDEVEGKYPKWLWGGYVAGSDSKKCENFIIENWGEHKLLSADIDEDNVFSDDYLRKIFSFLGVDYVSIDTSVKANPLIHIDNPLLMEFRILIKRIRQINPAIFDNRISRKLFNTFMKAVPVRKNAAEELDKFRDLFMDHFWAYEESLKKIDLTGK